MRVSLSRGDRVGVWLCRREMWSILKIWLLIKLGMV